MSKTFDKNLVALATLKAIRNSASDVYRTYIPDATQDNIDEVGEALWQYDPKFNEFTGLLAKVALTLTNKRLFENRLARFKGALLGTANTVEEYFLHKVKATVQDPTGADALAPKLLGMDIAYYSENRSETYKVTRSFKQVRNAFRSTEAVYSFLDELVQELYNSANIDEYMIMKELLGQVYTKATVYEVPEVAGDAKAARDFVKTVRKASNDMEEPTSDFHTVYTLKDGTVDEYERSDKIITHTPKGNQVLFINKDIEAEISVEVLATAFNKGDVASSISQIIVGDFGTMGEEEEFVGILADERLLVVHDTYKELLTQDNAAGAFTNYFLHIDQILALSPFANVIAFKTAADV